MPHRVGSPGALLRPGLWFVRMHERWGSGLVLWAVEEVTLRWEGKVCVLSGCFGGPELPGTPKADPRGPVRKISLGLGCKGKGRHHGGRGTPCQTSELLTCE